MQHESKIFNIKEFEKLTTIDEQKSYLDNIDLEHVDTYGNKPIHYICIHSTPDMIKYINTSIC